MDKVTTLQKELEAAIQAAKKLDKGFRLRQVVNPGINMYPGLGAFRAQAIKRIKNLMQDLNTEVR